MKKLSRLIGVASAAALVVVAATSSAIAAPAGASDCLSKSIGVAAPLTGPAGFLGQEQLSWSKYAVVAYNNQFGTSFKLVEGDTQLSASLARTVARQFVSNKNIMGVVGPSTSQAVISGGDLFEKVGLAAASGSATRVDLTNGQFKTFFRIVPNDAVQAPKVADFVSGVLKAKHVVVIDSQDDYSLALADRIQPRLEGQGITVDRESVAATDTDFSSLVSGVADDVGAVVFATQVGAAAHTLSQQLLEQGKKAVVIGTDGAYSPTQYKPKLGYVSVFDRDLNFEPSGKALVAGYKAYSKNKAFGAFGPPSYMAAWVLMTAMTKACEDGKITRPEVTTLVKQTNIPSSLGRTIRFNRSGEQVNAKFYIYKITNGKYSFVS